VEEVCRLYQESGYDFVSVTDHFLPHYDFPIADSRGCRNDGFTTLIGAELHTGEIEMGGIWHLLSVGLPLDFARPRHDETAAEMAARAMATGAYVAAAHPAWYSLTERDLESLGPIHAIEVYNGVAIDHNDRADSWHITDVMLGRGHRYLAYAADDFHGVNGRHDFQRGWIWVKATENTPGALLDALKAGHYYSSTGPRIFDVQVNAGKEIWVRCSPADEIFVTGKSSSSAAVYGNGMIEAAFDIRKFTSPYGRITVRDAQGGRAWTNPFWFDNE
jgi:hypothetical protein